jgi:hypothetical protein
MLNAKSYYIDEDQRQLTWINDIHERLAGLPCWQSAVLNVRYDWLLLAGEWALIRRWSN